MEKRTGVITFKGNPMTLVGNAVKVGDKAPDFVAIGAALNPVKLSDYAGKTVVIAFYPSIDTGVCAAQNRKFNTIANDMKDVVVLSISMDLPFAQARFCGAEGLDSVVTVSEYKDRDFAAKYGVMIEELGLLSRGTVVVDATGTVRLMEICAEVTDEPDYDATINLIKSL